MMLCASRAFACKIVVVLALIFSMSNPSVQALHSAFRSRIQDQLILAPLTRGGNLPFRRLCSDFGMEASVSEMVYSRFLVKGDRVEATRLRRPDNEKYFGVQIAVLLVAFAEASPMAGPEFAIALPVPDSAF